MTKSVIIRNYLCNMKAQNKAVDYVIKENALHPRTFKIGRQTENAKGGLAL